MQHLCSPKLPLTTADTALWPVFTLTCRLLCLAVCRCCAVCALRQFFSAYNNLLRTSNFVVQVSAFQLLSTLLFERSNHDVMMKYVNDPENLRLAMMQLKNPNRNLQLAVFHVLKIFVPNPYKADSIIRILSNNKQRFLAFLAEFEKDTSQHNSTHTYKHTYIHTYIHTSNHTREGRPRCSRQAGSDPTTPQCSVRNTASFAHSVFHPRSSCIVRVLLSSCCCVVSARGRRADMSQA